MSPAEAEDLFISAINEISLELKIFLKSIGFIISEVLFFNSSREILFFDSSTNFFLSWIICFRTLPNFISSPSYLIIQ